MVVEQKRVENVNGPDVQSKRSKDDEVLGGVHDTGLVGQVELVVEETGQSVEKNVASDCKAVEEEGGVVVESVRRLGWIRRIVGEVDPLMPMEESGLGRYF